MTIDYDALLTVEEKTEIVNRRIKALAAEAYQYTMNKKGFEDAGNEEAAEQMAVALVSLDALIAAHKEELNTLS